MLRSSPRLNASTANRRSPRSPRSPRRYMNSGMGAQGFGNNYPFGGRSSMFRGYPGAQGQAQGRFNVRRR